MSQPALSSRERPSNLDNCQPARHHYQPPELLPYTPVSPTHPSYLTHDHVHDSDHDLDHDLDHDHDYCAHDNSFCAQDSPTIIGRPYTGSGPQRSTQHSTRPSPRPLTILPYETGSGSSSPASTTTASPSSSGARFRRPAPSPLHNITAISPPNSPSPNSSRFNRPFAARDAPVAVLSSTSLTTGGRLVTNISGDLGTNTPLYNSDSSGPETIDRKQAIGTSLTVRIPNENRSVSDTVRKSGGTTKANTQAMPGASRMEAVRGPPRNSSIDSAVSSVSTGSSTPKNTQDVTSSSADVAKLVKAAGSPEAVIQYLLKEKQSQSQQNAQLWRLVDKQRAMILGLNKDLERSLKEKEKYRKKLKEVVDLRTPVVETSSAVALDAELASENACNPITVKAESPPKLPSLDIPASPSAGSDGSKLSPIDVSMAPYPITPPADRISNDPHSAVGEMLDPERAMPEASSHAFEKFDHDAEELEAETARRQIDDPEESPLIPAVLPLTAFEDIMPPPQGELPALPQPAATETETSAAGSADDGLRHFPAPLAPPLRKLPPAPLQLQTNRPVPDTAPNDESMEQTDSESEVDEITRTKRGRRKTRNEDDEIREIMVVKEAEARSLSKKSKQSNGGPATSNEPQLSKKASDPLPPLNLLPNLALPMLSPGLPASPRPQTMGSGPHSPPPSPHRGSTPAALLSARAPRQSIPLPPNTPLQTPLLQDVLVLKSPQPLNISKKIVEPDTVSTPTSSRESASERTRIFRGFMTEEYPDLLITPDALMAVNVKVASSRMKPSRASIMSLTQLEEDPVFTLAIMSRADGGELWRVEKDSLSLAKLDGKLKQCPEVIARTPDRSLFSGHAPARLDARRRALDLYLYEVLNTALDRNAALEMCRYLSTNVLPPNADEVGSSTGQDDEGGPKLGPGGRQYKNGYLTKRGKNFGGWKARFFVIEGPLLKYYETPGGAHLGTIKLQGAQIGRQSQNADPSSPIGTNDEMDNQYRHAFLILEPKKKDPTAMTKHVLCAESDKERDLWVSILLPWTSYKDSADEELKKGKPRQEPNSGHARGANAKKKTQVQSRSQLQTTEEADGLLIGVNYETTRQGDVPATEHLEPAPAMTMSSRQSYAIPTPQNSQWTSEPSSYANKMSSLAPPGMDDKKVKKRSFFGLGPKRRSSSESLSNDHAAPGSQSGGPIRRVFGAPLADAVRYNSPRDVRLQLPAVIYRCIQYLDAKGAINEEGIFRLSGSNIVIKALKERFDNEGDINLVDDEQYYDIHAVASMMKAYLRELPTSILTRDLHLHFVSVTEMKTQPEKIAALNDLVARLPLANLTLLRYLIAFLIKIIAHADRNKMTVRNVGIVFSPTLTIPAPVFALLLQNFEHIFGMSPHEYDLTSSASLHDRSDTHSIDMPPRPSTAGGVRESPHRHRLAEALADQRGANTPPPGHSAHPTPPLAQRYENPFAQQVGAGSARSGYESAYPTFDPTQYHLAQQRQGQQTPVYDQPYSTRSSRRESSLMMGLPPRGLTPQGSMSRSQEDTSPW